MGLFSRLFLIPYNFVQSFTFLKCLFFVLFGCYFTGQCTPLPQSFSSFFFFFFNLHWLQPSINSRCCPAGPCCVVCWEGTGTQQGFGSRFVSSKQRASGRTSLSTCRKGKAVNLSLVSNQLAESCRQGVALNSSQKTSFSSDRYFETSEA